MGWEADGLKKSNLKSIDQVEEKLNSSINEDFKTKEYQNRDRTLSVL